MPNVKKRSSSGSGPYSTLPPLVQSGDNAPRVMPPKLALGTARIKPFLQVNCSDPIVIPPSSTGGRISRVLSQT